MTLLTIKMIPKDEWTACNWLSKRRENTKRLGRTEKCCSRTLHTSLDTECFWGGYEPWRNNGIKHGTNKQRGTHVIEKEVGCSCGLFCNGKKRPKMEKVACLSFPSNLFMAGHMVVGNEGINTSINVYLTSHCYQSSSKKYEWPFKVHVLKVMDTIKSVHLQTHGHTHPMWVSPLQTQSLRPGMPWILFKWNGNESETDQSTK